MPIQVTWESPAPPEHVLAAIRAYAPTRSGPGEAKVRHRELHPSGPTWIESRIRGARFRLTLSESRDFGRVTLRGTVRPMEAGSRIVATVGRDPGLFVGPGLLLALALGATVGGGDATAFWVLGLGLLGFAVAYHRALPPERAREARLLLERLREAVEAAGRGGT